MAKFAKHLNSLVAGELSPNFYGRTDADQYNQGAQEITNKIVRPQGGAFRRPGTIFIADGIRNEHGSLLASFDSEIRIIDFRFSRTDTTFIVLSTGNNGLNAYGIAIWDPNTKLFVSPTVSLTSNYVQFAGWTSQADLDEIQYTQSGDVLVLVSKKNPPIFITRTSAGSSVTQSAYTLRDIYSIRDVFQPARTAYAGSDTTVMSKLSPDTPPQETSSKPYYNFPYRLADAAVVTVSASATTGSITLTFTGAKPGEYVGGGITGTILRLTKSGVTGFVRVNSTSGFTASCTVIKTLGGTGTQDSWEFQDFGAETDGWPKTVAFHDQRIWYGNAGTKTNTVWASQVGDFSEMMITRPADDANFDAISNDRPFSYTLAANQVDDIEWFLSSKSTLFIGTTGGEWLALHSQDSIVGPLSPNFQPETDYGSKPLRAISANGSTIFVDRTGQHIREFIYNRDVDNYRAVDLTYFADHLFKKGLDIYSDYEKPDIKSIAFQSGQNSIVWALDSNGMLHALSIDKDYGTLAWSTMQFGGVNDSDDLPPQVKSFITLPNADGSDDDIYLIVHRYLNGGTKLYLEKIASEFIGPSLDNSSVEIEDQPVFSDSAVLVHAMPSPKFFCKYTASIDADYWQTSGTGSGTGSPTISSGLVLTGGSNKFVSYNSANAAGMIQQGTIALEVTPNWSGDPAADRYFFAISKTNADQANLLTLFHSGSTGKLSFTIKDSAGSGVTVSFQDVAGGVHWIPVAGTKYKIVLSYNATTGIYKLKVNDRLFVDNYFGSPSALTRSSAIGNFVIGTNYDHSKNSDFTIHKFAMCADDFGMDLENFNFPEAFAVGAFTMGVNHLYGDGDVLGDGYDQGSLDLRTEDLSTALDGKAIVGLNYVSRLKLMDLEAGSILGSAQSAMKRIHEIGVKFFRTVGASYGPSTDELDPINFQDTTYVTGDPIPLFTGTKTLAFQAGYDRAMTPIIQQDRPYPCSVTSIVLKGVTSDT